MTTITPTTQAVKRIVRLDASGLKDSHCRRKIYLRIIEGFRGKGQKNDTFYGTCFHHFAEEYEKRPGQTMQIMEDVQMRYMKEPGITVAYNKDYLDVVHLSRTCQGYIAAQSATNTQWTSAEIIRSPCDNEAYKEGDPLVEVKFSMPICVTDTTEFLLQGTIDRIAKIRNGCLVLEDYKSTAQKDAAAFFKGHKMGPQAKTYIFAIRQMAAANPNGLFAKLLNSNPKVGFRIKGVFLDPKLSTRFETSDVFQYEDSELEEHYDLLINQCRALELDMALTQTLPAAEGQFNDTCRSAFGSYCPYFDACQNYGKIGRSGVLAVLGAHLHKTEYLPLNFGGGQQTTKEE